MRRNKWVWLAVLGILLTSTGMIAGFASIAYHSGGENAWLPLLFWCIGLMVVGVPTMVASFVKLEKSIV